MRCTAKTPHNLEVSEYGQDLLDHAAIKAALMKYLCPYQD